MLALTKLADLKAVSQGGYPQVEINNSCSISCGLISETFSLMDVFFFLLTLSRLSGAGFLLDIQTY